MNPKTRKVYRFCQQDQCARLLWLLWLLLLLGQWVQAEVVQPNTRYEAGSWIEFPQHGVGFTLPEPLYGMLSPSNPQGEFVAVLGGVAETGDHGIILQLGQGNVQQMARQMNGPMEFKGTQLQPLAESRMVEGAVFNEFGYTDKGQAYKAFMLMLGTQGQGAVLLVAASPEALFPRYRQAALALAQGLRLTGDTTTAHDHSHNTSAQAPGEQAPGEQPTGERAMALVGAWMNRRNASNGIYLETSSKWVFSADGTVAWGSGTVIAGGTTGVSLRGGGDGPVYYGRWRTEGETLYLNWDDGTVEQRQFSVFDYDGRPALALTANGETYYFKRID